jgi:hypothetical protein
MYVIPDARDQEVRSMQSLNLSQQITQRVADLMLTAIRFVHGVATCPRAFYLYE